MTVHGDEYECIECWHSPDTPLEAPWDRQTWLEGYTRGYAEGLEAGRHLGFRTLRSDLRAQLSTLGVDLQLQLLDLQTPTEVWREVTTLVEQTEP